MLEALLVTALVVQAGQVKLVGSAETVKAGKATAYAGEEVTLEAEGPNGLLLELRADGTKPEKLSVVLLRDGRYRSENSVAFKPNKKGAPPGFTLFAKLGLDLPEGTHQVVITAGGRRIAVSPSLVKKVPKPVAAAAEKDTGGGGGSAVAAAAPAPVPEAAPAPAPAPTASAPPPAPKTELLAAAPVNQDMVGEPEAPRASGGLQQATRVAVYDFELQGVEANIGQVVTDSTLAEVRKLQSVSAIGMDEIRDMLSHEANKQYLGCEANESCLAEIAGALGVDELVSGKLSKVDDGTSFIVRRIDQRRAKVVGVVTKRLAAGTGEELLAAIGPAIEELFPDRPLRSGVERGVPKEMALRLDPPPLPTFATLGVGALAVLAGAAGGVFGIMARSSEESFQTQANLAKTQVVDGRTLTKLGADAQQRADYANYSFIGAGVFALTAGVMALFTDWYGYGEEAAKPQ